MIPLNKQRVQNIILGLMAMCMAWGLKDHYSEAHAESLKWILAPTAILVERVTGNPFYFQADSGYISHDLRVIIAPACAGVNFLIAAFGMSAFCGIIRLSGLKSRFIWLAGSAALAYAATISVNALRILISIVAISSDIHAGWITPQRVHRMTGILIYFFFLSMFYHIIQNILHHIGIQTHVRNHKPKVSEQKNHMTAKRHHRIGQSIPFGILPLVCYWAIAIGVPWLNAGYEKDPAGFTEHSLTVTILSLTLFGMIFIIRTQAARVNLRRNKKPPFSGIF